MWVQTHFLVLFVNKKYPEIYILLWKSPEQKESKSFTSKVFVHSIVALPGTSQQFLSIKNYPSCMCSSAGAVDDSTILLNLGTLTHRIQYITHNYCLCHDSAVFSLMSRSPGTEHRSSARSRPRRRCWWCRWGKSATPPASSHVRTPPVPLRSVVLILESKLKLGNFK